MPDKEFVTESQLEKSLEKVGEVWESSFKEYQERAEEERDRLNNTLTETQAALDRIQDELDRREEQFRELQKQRESQTKEQGSEGIDIPGTKDRDAFESYLRKHPGHSMQPDTVKKLVSSDDTAGGYLAPPEMASGIIQDIVEMSPIFELAERRTTSNTYVQIMRRTDVSEAVWISEGASRNEVQNPQYGMERIDNFPLHALHLVTYEELEDAAVDLESAIRDEIAEQFAVSFNKAFVQGSGAGRPEGILNNPDVTEVATGDSSSITADGLIDLHYEIKTPYSDSTNAYFLMDRKTIREVRKLKDSDGDYIWNPGLAEDQQPTILESAYREATDLVAPDSNGDYTAGEFPILFGDFQEGYTISDRVQVSIQRLDEKYSDQGAIGFQGRRRIGGQVTKPEALAKQKVAS